MVPAGTRVIASVAGAFDVVKAPGELENFARQQLAPFGQVVSVEVTSSLFSDQYTAHVEYITDEAHGSMEDIRATVAGVFERWNGIRPAVSLISEGETRAPATSSPFNPFPDFDPAQWTPLIWAGAALVAVVVVASVVRR